MPNYYETYEKIEKLVVDLNSNWKLQNDLFQAPENIDIFNDAAPAVWTILRDSLIDTVFLDISRLMDPPQTMGKDNLSLAYIISIIPHPDTANAASEKYIQVRNTYRKSIQKWRNLKLSHNSLDTIKGVQKLPDVDFDLIDQFVEDINSLTELLNSAGPDIQTNYVPIVSSSRWVPKLMLVLKNGIPPKNTSA